MQGNCKRIFVFCLHKILEVNCQLETHILRLRLRKLAAAEMGLTHSIEFKNFIRSEKQNWGYFESHFKRILNKIQFLSLITLQNKSKK